MKTKPKMIKVEVTPEQAVALLMMLEAEQKDYTTDPTCTPTRIVAIRELMTVLDKKLDDHYEYETSGK